MADAGDERRFAIEHGPRHPFLVERPQVFERTAAARQDQDIAFPPRIGPRDRRGDL